MSQVNDSNLPAKPTRRALLAMLPGLAFVPSITPPRKKTRCAMKFTAPNVLPWYVRCKKEYSMQEFVVDGIPVHSFSCFDCGAFPGEVDARQAIERLRTRSLRCAACGEGFRMLDACLGHQGHHPFPGPLLWESALVRYEDVLTIEGVEEFRLSVHGICMANAFPMLPRESRDSLVDSRRRGMWSIAGPCGDGWTTTPVETLPWGQRTGFYGEYETTIGEAGEVLFPAAWAAGETTLRCFRLPGDIRTLEIRRTGQLTVPKDLLVQIGVQGKAVHVVGMASWCEVWSPEGWAQATSSTPRPTFW